MGYKYMPPVRQQRYGGWKYLETLTYLTYPRRLLSQGCVYIEYMTEENDIELDNVADFTAYKMRNIVEDLAQQGQLDIADAIQDALDLYLLGDIDICFIDGWPHIPNNTKES